MCMAGVQQCGAGAEGHVRGHTLVSSTSQQQALPSRSETMELGLRAPPSRGGCAQNLQLVMSRVCRGMVPSVRVDAGSVPRRVKRLLVNDELAASAQGLGQPAPLLLVLDRIADLVAGVQALPVPVGLRGIVPR